MGYDNICYGKNMKIWNTKLSSTEKRIIELKQEIANKSKELAERLVDVGVSQSQLDGLVKQDNLNLSTMAVSLWNFNYV